MAENEEWIECEESTVVVEIQGIIKPDFLANVTKARILGIDTDSPYLQLDDNTFTGTYQDTMGTALLFKEISEDKSDSPHGDESSEPQLKYECKTCKKLCMQRIFIKPRTGTDETQDPTTKSTECEIPDSERTVKSDDILTSDKVTENLHAYKSQDRLASDEVIGQMATEEVTEKMSTDTDKNYFTSDGVQENVSANQNTDQLTVIQNENLSTVEAEDNLNSIQAMER